MHPQSRAKRRGKREYRRKRQEMPPIGEVGELSGKSFPDTRENLFYDMFLPADLAQLGNRRIVVIGERDQDCDGRRQPKRNRLPPHTHGKHPWQRGGGGG